MIAARTESIAEAVLEALGTGRQREPFTSVSPDFSSADAYAVTARFNDVPDIGTLTRMADELVRDTDIAACEIWTAVDPAGQPVSQEEKLRGGDKKIKACLMADTLRQGDAEKLGQRLAKQFPAADVGVFRVLCQLGHGVEF